MQRNHEVSSKQCKKALEYEIAELRSELGVVVHEVERRARQAVNVRRQARRHPLVSFAALALLTGTLILAIAYPIQQRRRRERASRLRNLRLALAHLMIHPEHVIRTRRPTVGERLLGAGTSIGTFGAKQLLRRRLAFRP